MLALATAALAAVGLAMEAPPTEAPEPGSPSAALALSAGVPSTVSGSGEAEAGSDVSGLRTTATRDGAGWQLSLDGATVRAKHVVLACGGYLAGLRREVDHPIESLFCEQGGHAGPIRNVHQHEAEGRIGREPRQAITLDLRIVVVVHVVNAHNFVTSGEK